MNDIKPKRKYVRKAKVVVDDKVQQHAVVVEQVVPKPKRKYVRRVKPVAQPVNEHKEDSIVTDSKDWFQAVTEVIFEISRTIGSQTITNLEHIKPLLDRISAVKGNHDNNNIPEKVSQILQQCRDAGMLEFVKGKPGTYKLVMHPHDALAMAKKPGNSKGERTLIALFNTWGVKYISQFVDRRIRNINALPFDFYIPSTNTLIEYDGADHNGPIARSKSLVKNVVRYFERKKTDAYKTSCAEKHGYNLLRINVDMFNKGTPTLEQMLELDLVKTLLLQQTSAPRDPS